MRGGTETARFPVDRAKLDENVAPAFMPANPAGGGISRAQRDEGGLKDYPLLLFGSLKGFLIRSPGVDAERPPLGNMTTYMNLP